MAAEFSVELADLSAELVAHRTGDLIFLHLRIQEMLASELLFECNLVDNVLYLVDHSSRIMMVINEISIMASTTTVRNSRGESPGLLWWFMAGRCLVAHAYGWCLIRFEGFAIELFHADSFAMAQVFSALSGTGVVRWSRLHISLASCHLRFANGLLHFRICFGAEE
jgi:hypothetical protein